MKKTIPFILILLFILSLSSIIQPCLCVEVIDSSSNELVNANRARTSFYSVGRIWAFYLEKEGSEYRYIKFKSKSGTWQNETVFYDAGSGYGTRFGIWYDGTYVLIAYHEQYNTNLKAVLFRMGTPNANGSITWGTEYECAPPVDGKYYRGTVSVCRENGGDAHIWVLIVAWAEVPTEHVCTAYESSTNDGSGSWTMRGGSPADLLILLTTQIVPLAINGSILMIWSETDEPHRLYSKYWDGSGWSSNTIIEDSVGANDIDPIMVAENNNDTYLIYGVANNDSALYGRKFTFATWGSKITINYTDNYRYSCISWDKTANILYVFYIKNNQVMKQQANGSPTNPTFSNEEWLIGTRYNPKEIRTYGRRINNDIFVIWQESNTYYLMGENLAGFFGSEETISWLDKYFLLGYGIVGIILMVFAPTWVAYGLRNKAFNPDKIERIGTAILIFCIGFGLFMSWLGA